MNTDELLATAEPRRPEQWRWYLRHQDNDDPDASDLEPELFALLTGGVLSYSANWRGYATEAAAKEALHEAVRKYNHNSSEN